MSENTILNIKDLSVIYKTDLETVEAVNGINIAIKRKSTFGLVGETGAGKTTTARSIIRLLPAVGHVTGGSIEFEGKNLRELSEEEMRQYRGEKIAMVFQDPMTSLNPVMSVGDQIAETIKIHNPELSKEEVEQRVESTLAMVGILPSRNCAGLRAGPADCRRADHRAGCDHSGAGADDDQRSAGTSRHLHADDHP